jgi:hypothetical protein
VNVDRSWLGVSVVRVRVLSAGLMLVLAGCLALGWGPHSRPGITTSALQNQMPAASYLALSQPRSAAPVPSAATFRPSTPSSVFSCLPLIFEPNQGQANLDRADSRARFIARGSGFNVLLGSDGAIFNLRSSLRSESSNPSTRRDSARNDAPQNDAPQRFESFRMKLAGANPNASLTATDLLPGKSNYILGNDPARWRHGIPQFARVRYENIYPGINLVFYGHEGRLEYDFQVAAGAEASRAELEFDGADAVELRDGAVLIQRRGASMRLEALRVYQEIAGRKQTVNARFVLRGPNHIGFALGPYDHARELIIDPIPSFSTYFGGTGDERATSVTLDGSGNVYLTGSTNSPNLPVTTGAYQNSLNTTPPATNVYIAKITPGNPSILDYVTYVGGNGTDAPVGIAVDGAGDAFIAGTTTSTNFPHTPTAYQTVPETGTTTPVSHVFVTELNPTASTLQYSSYLSGNGTDFASGMTIDASGNLYVTGTTNSTDVGSPTGSQFPSSSLPYAVPFQISSLALPQFFVTKVNTFNAGKASIAYSTYFGGSITANGTPAVSTGGGIAVDVNGNIYFDGTTNYTYTNGEVGDFPILNAYQPCLNQPPPVTVTNPPVCTNAATSTQTDAFLAKINPNVAQGEQLQWSSYFGGTQTDSATGIAIDVGAANVFVVGTTNSPGITGTANFASYQICLNTPVNPISTADCNLSTPAANDAFVARLSNPVSTTVNNNMTLNYFSYLGGSGDEAGQAITVDSADGALLTGWTQSSDFPIFPTPNDGIQSTLTGMRDAFIARLNTTATQGQGSSAVWATYFGGTNTITPGVLATTEGTGVALDVFEDTFFAGDTNAIDLSVSGSPQATNGGGFDAFATELRTAATVTVSGVLTLGTNQTFISAGSPAVFTYTVTNNGPDLATGLVLTDNLLQSVTGVAFTNVAVSATSGTCSGGGGSTTTSVACNIGTLQAAATSTVTITLTPAANSTGTSASFNGGTVQVTGPNNIFLASTSVSAKMSDFSLAVNPPNNSVNKAGDTAPYQVKLTPSPIYTTAIALSCSGNIPTGASCNFAPTNSVTLASTSPGAATLNITTTARPIVTGSAQYGFRHFYALWIFTPGFALLAIGVSGNRRRRRILGFLMLCALFAPLLLLPACSTATTQIPTGGTQAGTYNITVTATSGTDVKSQGIQLTVP